MQQKREQLSLKLQESILNDGMGNGNADRKNNDDHNIERIIDKMMMYNIAANMMNEKKKNDDEPAWVREIREENRKLRELMTKQEEEKRIDKVREELGAQLQALRDDLKGSKDPKKDELIEKLNKIEEQMIKKQEDEKHNELIKQFESLKSDYDDLRSAMEESKRNPQKNDLESYIEQLAKIEDSKKKLAKALGLNEKDAEQMGIGDFLEKGADLLPRIGEGIATVRDAFRTKEIEDDVPPPPPPNYDAPVRDTPASSPTIDPRIEAFLKQCTERQGQLIDPEGIPWTMTDGRPISKQELRDLALIAPEPILARINEIPERQRSRRFMPKREPPTPAKETKAPEKTEENPFAEDLKKPEEKKQEPVPEEEPVEEPVEEPPVLEEIEEKPDEFDLKGYVDSLTPVKLENGKDALVGSDGEYYMDAHGEPVAKKDILMSALDKKAVDTAKENARSIQNKLKEEGNDGLKDSSE